MDIKKPTKAELTAWLKDNGFDHDAHVYVPASKVADMPDRPATSIGDLLKEYMNKVETPDDYNLIPKEPTVHNIDLTKKTPEDYWKKLALDFRADRDRLQKENEELRKEVEECIKAIKDTNAARYETHKELMMARQEAREKQATIDRLRAEWNRTIDLALAYEDKLQQINKDWPGILGGEELRALMMTNSNKA
jgi:predicted RNase H-like nuclease (RuvC/YqgF family)